MDKDSLKEKLQGLRDKAMGELEKRGLLAKIKEKKKIVIGCGVVAFLLLVSTCVGLGTGSMGGDEGGEYRTVKMGDRVWMAKNLNVPTKEGSWCYDNKPEHCKKYGRLYTWAAAMKLPAACNKEKCEDKVKYPHQGICPDGFHIPTSGELKSLETLGEVQLKSAGGRGKNGSETYGFSALPAGLYSTGFERFSDLGRNAYFWSTEDYAGWMAGYLVVRFFDSGVSLGDFDKGIALSVRCVKD